MRLLKKAIEKDKSGFVQLLPEESEDMWRESPDGRDSGAPGRSKRGWTVVRAFRRAPDIYNILQIGDQLRASTLRRVVTESASGATDKSTVRTTLTIRVTKVDFDVQGMMLRVNGRNIVENKWVKLGQYHTLDLELNRSFMLYKAEWDMIALDTIEEATDITKRAEIAAIVMQDGLANICLVMESLTITRQRIETFIPKKWKGTTSGHDKALVKFFDQVYQGILRHINLAIVKVVIIASPAFVRERMFEYILSEATRTDNRLVLENRSKFVLVHCSSGHKQALREVLADKAIQSKLADTRYARESRALELFFRTLNDVPEKAYYSYNHVRLAADLGAVGTLLVTDALFRSADIPTRRKYVQLVEDVRNSGGEVMVLSSLHISGEQLQSVSGVAAILKFPMEEPEEGFVEEEMPQAQDYDNIEDELEALKTSNKMSKGLIDDVWADDDRMM
ncbi:hypothetical protein DFJ74DRAFT_28890 [Hyaloraphidium curvatum]|nr:hypothetical protein DFJ74DRAFT_28890 [Hyaloraphidium curvatum]